MGPPLLLGAVVRAAVDYGGGMLVGAILGVIVPQLMDVALKSDAVTPSNQVVVWMSQTVTWFPFAVLLGLATTFIVRSVVEGSAPS